MAEVLLYNLQGARAPEAQAGTAKDEAKGESIMYYSGEMIEGLVKTVDKVRARHAEAARTKQETRAWYEMQSRTLLRWYRMQDSHGLTTGREFEMFHDDAATQNRVLSEAGSDWRWCVVPEKGAR